MEDLVREEERRDVGLVFWDVFLVFWDGDDASAKTRLLVLVRLERLNAGMVLWCGGRRRVQTVKSQVCQQIKCGAKTGNHPL